MWSLFSLHVEPAPHLLSPYFDHLHRAHYKSPPSNHSFRYASRQRPIFQLYQPISNLSLICKIIERVVKCRLIDHLVSNGLINPNQSACCKHHSTETALLYIHDRLTNAIGLQKLSCLCLLDLPAAFDTIDHNILITRLSSWFGIHGSVFKWIT